MERGVEGTERGLRRREEWPRLDERRRGELGREERGVSKGIVGS